MPELSISSTRGILTQILCGYEVQVNMFFFNFKRKSIFSKQRVLTVNICIFTNHLGK